MLSTVEEIAGHVVEAIVKTSKGRHPIAVNGEKEYPEGDEW